MKPSSAEMTRPEVKLPETYHRVLSVLSQQIEEMLDEISDLMQVEGKEKITLSIRPTYTKEERERALVAAERMREKLKEFVSAFKLHKQRLSEARIMEAKLTHLWAMLEDTRPENLVGYGKIPSPLQKEITKWVEDFLQLLRELESK
jgi:hypothetical protein